MTTETFSQAVESTIAEFANQSRDFSAHDITNALRARVNDNQLEIAGALREDVDNTKDTFRIDHNAVREEVRAAFNRQAFQNYTLGYDNRGGYRVYRYVAATPAPQFSNMITAANLPSVSGPTTTVSQVRVTLTDAELEDKIKTYLDAQLTQGNNPRLKRVQSRLKNVSVTCEELFKKIDAMGYEMVGSPVALNHYSLYSVLRKK